MGTPRMATPPTAPMPEGRPQTNQQNHTLLECGGLTGDAQCGHFRQEESQGRQLSEERRPHLEAEKQAEPRSQPELTWDLGAVLPN